MKSPRLGLILILLLALAARLITLSTRTLWYDEAFAVLFSQAGLQKMLYGTLTPVNGVAADVHPLLYYTTLNVWMSVFGDGVFAVRIYSVLISLITIVMLHLLARELFDEKTALVAALIAALAPFYVQYSQEVRMYALLGLLLIAATWCFIRGWRTSKAIYWIGFGILAGLSMYAQQLAGFYLVALGLIPFLMRRRDQIIRVALSAGLAMLVYLPWLINLPSQFSKIGAYWIPQPTLSTPILTLLIYLLGDLEIKNPLVGLVGMIALALVIVFLLVFSLKRPNRDRNTIGFTLWLAIAPMALMWIVSQYRPVYLPRGLLSSGLMFYLALAWLLARVRLPQLIRLVIVIPLILTALSGLYLNYNWHTFPRGPSEEAGYYIGQNWQPGDQVVHANKITMLPMVYYDWLLGFGSAPLSQSYIQDVPGSGTDTLARPTQQALGLLADECLASAAKGSPRVWYVIFDRQVSEQSDSSGTTPDLRWLDAHYHQVSMTPFSDLLVYLYNQPDATAKNQACSP